MMTPEEKRLWCDFEEHKDANLATFKSVLDGLKIISDRLDKLESSPAPEKAGPLPS